MSVIIPVYNVERYLDECIGSIIKYGKNDIEIVLIDDGSTDKSGDICDEWARKDLRISVVHKENGGASEARNTGIEIAKGRYYFFLDSDDYITQIDKFDRVIDYLYKERPQILMINWCKFYNNTISKKSKFGIETDEFIQYTIEEVVSNGMYHASPCNKIIMSDIIKSNGIRFPKDRIAEDIEYCGNLLNYVDHVTVYNCPIYQYRMREGSRSKNIGKKSLNDIYEMICSGIDEEENSLKKIFFSYEYAVLLGISGDADKELRKKIYDLKELLNDGKSPKVKMVNLVKTIFGIKITRIILMTFVRIKNEWKI